jgi:hypothetical protein
MHSLRFRINAHLVFSALLSCAVLTGQTPTEFKIGSMDAVLKGGNKFLDVFFTQPLDAAHAEDLATAGVAVEALPSKNALTVTGIKRLGGDPTELEITLSGDAAPSDVQVKLTISRALNFRDGQNAHPGSGPFTFTSTLIKDSKTLQDGMQKLVDEMTKAGKPSQEKNIFASGFVTTASGGQTQGGADIHLNSMDLGIPGLKSFLNIQKTTSDGSDAKNFEAGGTYRSTFLIGKAGRTAIQTALTAYRNATTDAAKQSAATQYNTAVVDFQKATIAAVFLDFTGKLEGQATNFNVTNGVFEGSLKVQSRVKTLFGSKQGFFHFQILPAGFEGGKTLRQPDATPATTAAATPPAATSPPAATTPPAATATEKALQQLDGIARFKTGATLNAFWKNPQPIGPLRQFEVEAGVVDRFLFLKEIHYDTATKTNSTILDGNKAYFHADAKLFVVESSAGRYGVKMSYARGSLPPVYAPVKSFQFGFLFESVN